MTTHKLKTSEIFEFAKNQIALEENKYICSSFSQLCLSYRDERRVKDIIIQLLDGEYTLESWLAKRIGISVNILYYNYPDEMRKLRLRWLDSLIQTHKEKGD